LQEIEKHFDKNRKTDWYNKGNILRNLKKDDKAILCYDEALFLDTHYVKVWYRKGQTLYENNKFEDARKCFNNVLELEKSRLNKDSLVVKPTSEGGVYESNVWSFAATFMCALSYFGEKKFDDADVTFTTFYKIVGSLPPFDSIESDKFIKYCLENSHKILDGLEPNMIAEIGITGKKH
jgi:tetratricopeptide (TPR) repeat protein